MHFLFFTCSVLCTFSTNYSVLNLKFSWWNASKTRDYISILSKLAFPPSPLDSLGLGALQFEGVPKSKHLAYLWWFLGVCLLDLPHMNTHKMYQNSLPSLLYYYLRFYIHCFATIHDLYFTISYVIQRWCPRQNQSASSDPASHRQDTPQCVFFQVSHMWHQS